MMESNTHDNKSVWPTLQLADEIFALGRYTPVSQTIINETQQLQLKLEGNTTIALPVWRLQAFIFTKSWCIYH